MSHTAKPAPGEAVADAMEAVAKDIEEDLRAKWGHQTARGPPSCTPAPASDRETALRPAS